MWYVIVRYEKEDQTPTLCNGDFGVEGGCGQVHANKVYPKEGYPISIFADKERAEQVCRGNGIKYKVVEVTLNEQNNK